MEFSAVLLKSKLPSVLLGGEIAPHEAWEGCGSLPGTSQGVGAFLDNQPHGGPSLFATTTHCRSLVEGDGSGFALAASALAIFLLFPPFTAAAEESKSDTIGLWKIEAVFKGDTFDRCSINRTLQDDIVATFVRTGEALSLELQSPNWKLEDGKHYPVKMTLGPLSIDSEVAARPNFVSTEIKDEKFAATLRSASALNVVSAGATIHVPLDKSKVAFDRLEECVEKNNGAVQTSPFGTGTSALTTGVSEGEANDNTAAAQGVHAITPEETKRAGPRRRKGFTRSRRKRPRRPGPPEQPSKARSRGGANSEPRDPARYRIFCEELIPSRWVADEDLGRRTPSPLADFLSGLTARPLLGVKRTPLVRALMSANDP